MNRTGLTMALAVLFLGSCSPGGGSGGPAVDATADASTGGGEARGGDAVAGWDGSDVEGGADVPADPCAGLGPECLPVVQRGPIEVVYLHGTPYEMGFQHAMLLHEQLVDGVAQIEGDLVLSTMMLLALDSGLLDLAMERSLPEIIEECQGMADGAADIGWTMDHCMLLNFGDVIAEFIQHGMPGKGNIAPACSEVIASGAATSDGKTYQLRILDWALIQFILDNPVVFVRSPKGKIPHVFIGFPGNLSPYQGMNAMGLVSASNEIDPRDNSVHDSVGVSHVQLQARLLAEAHDRAEATQMITSADHMTLELFGLSDPAGGAIFEMAPAAVGIREQEEGIVFATNHFLATATADLDEEPGSVSSLLRYERLAQLLDPASEQSVYGSLSPETLVQVARDRVDPYTGQETAADVFDNNRSIATNGALFVVIFDPAELRFWVASGAVPVPLQKFVGFSLGELLGMPGYEGTTPADIQ